MRIKDLMFLIFMAVGGLVIGFEIVMQIKIETYKSLLKEYEAVCTSKQNWIKRSDKLCANGFVSFEIFEDHIEVVCK